MPERECIVIDLPVAVSRMIDCLERAANHADRPGAINYWFAKAEVYASTLWWEAAQ